MTQRGSNPLGGRSQAAGTAAGSILAGGVLYAIMEGTGWQPSSEALLAIMGAVTVVFNYALRWLPQPKSPSP